MMRTEAEYQELHTAYRALVDTVEAGGRLLGAIVWRYGAGVGDERLLLVDDSAVPYAVRATFTDGTWTVVAFVETEEGTL